ncbi:hypothetical protein BU17DRAFT_61186 [Hysterangium stoloniferum]|nr:hypothetical protein BU17DRAFT_61186 [Hysterangium stoloniferum]
MSNRTSILMASSFALKENSVVNSCTSSGRCVPVRKPIPAVFAAAHKGKQIENDMDNAVVHEVTRQNKENRKSHMLVDLTKLKANKEVNITTPVSEGRVGAAGLLTPVVEDPPCLFMSDTFPRSMKESTGITGLKQSIKHLLENGVWLYKSSALGSYGNLLGNKSTTGLSSVTPELSHSTEGDSTRPSKDTKESWESDAAVHIERVVEDARANFAAGSMTPLPPPPPWTAQANCRASAKVTEIFQDKNAAGDNSLNDAPPVHQRRVTLVSKSPENHDGEQNRSSDDPAPMPETARKGTSQSVIDFAHPITPLVTLELELTKSGANYDEILMSSLGVKSLGKGIAPPPETPRKAVSVDELGALSAAQESAARKDDGNPPLCPNSDPHVNACPDDASTLPRVSSTLNQDASAFFLAVLYLQLKGMQKYYIVWELCKSGWLLVPIGVQWETLASDYSISNVLPHGLSLLSSDPFPRQSGNIAGHAGITSVKKIYNMLHRRGRSASGSCINEFARRRCQNMVNLTLHIPQDIRLFVPLVDLELQSLIKDGGVETFNIN